jgi:hypothetical protein
MFAATVTFVVMNTGNCHRFHILYAFQTRHRPTIPRCTSVAEQQALKDDQPFATHSETPLACVNRRSVAFHDSGSSRNELQIVTQFGCTATA